VELQARRRGLHVLASAPAVRIAVVLCPMTGIDHRLFWMRSAWWVPRLPPEDRDVL